MRRSYAHSKEIVMHALNKKATGRVTIADAQKTLNCTYENARKLIERMCADGTLMRCPFTNATGAAEFAVPGNWEVQREFVILAAGTDIWKWMGETYTRNEMLSLVRELDRNRENQGDVTNTAVSHILAAISNSPDAITREIAGVIADQFRLIAETYQAMADNESMA